MVICRECDLPKLPEELVPRYRNWCRECKRAWGRAYSAANRERISEQRKRRYREDAELRERRKADSRARYAADSERILKRNKEWADENKDRVKASSAKYYAEHREERIAYAVARKKANPEQTRDWNLRSLYGITLVQYNEMLESQNGVCAICGDPPGTGRGHQVLQVDHCHTTGRIRGLLCGPCNLGIGSLRDDPKRLRAGAEYLERGDQ